MWLPEMAIERIEGRCDDLLQLPGYNGKMVTIFADPVRGLCESLTCYC